MPICELVQRFKESRVQEQDADRDDPMTRFNVLQLLGIRTPNVGVLFCYENAWKGCQGSLDVL